MLLNNNKWVTKKMITLPLACHTLLRLRKTFDPHQQTVPPWRYFREHWFRKFPRELWWPSILSVVKLQAAHICKPKWNKTTVCYWENDQPIIPCRPQINICILGTGRFKLIKKNLTQKSSFLLQNSNATWWGLLRGEPYIDICTQCVIMTPLGWGWGGYH